jgi:trans-aconitate 2-methyltransferase
MQSVYDAAGGYEGLLRLSRAWHERVMADEIVSHAFSHGFHPRHSERLAAYWAEALGGPPTFTTSYGDESSVVRMHSGNGEHEEMDRRAIACFDAALGDVGFDDRLRGVLHDYFAWATTTTMARYPRSPADVPDGLELPPWTWDGLERDSWDPAQYERFARERSAPFFDLLELVEPCPGGRVVDLGCGTGRLTRALHERTQAAGTAGLDSSPAMLERAAEHGGDGVTFERGDIAKWAPSAPVDLVFSNAALHWVDDHEALFARLTGALAPGGQLAVQVPANHDHASHLVAERVAAEAPFRDTLGGYVRRSPVLAPERYARLLHRLGHQDQRVRLHVYLHVLPDAGAVVEWVKGTLLTVYERRLPEDAYEAFVARYRELLLAELPDERPFAFTFKRILIWGRLPA